MVLSADFSRLSWEVFEYMCEDLLRAQGFTVTSRPARGPDGAKDMIAKRYYTDDMGVTEEQIYLVECKHLSNSGRSVYDSDIGNFQANLSFHQANRYLLITSTLPSETVKNQLQGVSDDPSIPFKALFWAKTDLMKHLLKYTDILRKYFPTPSSGLSRMTDEVAFWLEARGYTIQDRRTRGESLEDIQVLLPERARLVTRCILGEIDISQVKEFQDSIAKDKFNLGWIISDKRVAQSAREYCSSFNNLRVFNMADFVRDVFGTYFDYLTGLADTKIVKYYVDLACEKPVFDVPEGNPVPRGTYDKYPIIDNFIDDWVSDFSKNHISILGEFGQGKTWFCIHYAYRQLQRYVQDPLHQRLPLFVPLRNYRSAHIRQVITDLLINDYGVKAPNSYQLFDRLNRSGRLLLIFDGFDEMTTEVDHEATVANFEALADVVVADSKVLLTCRTPYFRSMMEEREILASKGQNHGVPDRPNFEILYLQEFDEDRITEVIRRRVPDLWEQYTKRIRDVYDLPNCDSSSYCISVFPG